jgi:Leucine-rich repeat (LRR) protein
MACLLCWLSIEIRRYREDHRVMVDAAESGGTAHFTAREPKWLWSKFGHDIAKKGTSLILSDSDVSDSQIAGLGSLSHLGGLYLDRTPVTNKGLVCLKNLDGLIALGLQRTKVTELPCLSHMKQLVELDLSFSKVSTLDLTGLESLRKLSLRETMISDETVAAFPPLPELSNLDISCMPGRNPRVTDKGIRAITKENFPKLKTLYIYDCGISDREISRLKAEFPMLKIIR